MKLLCSIIFAWTALCGCAKKSDTVPAVTTTMTNSTDTPDTTNTTLNYLALGDSYTIGEAVPDTESYPYQLAAQLNKQVYQVNTPTIIATTGWTTQNLIDAVANAKLHQKYDIVTLLIGVNDQYQGISSTDYHQRFIQILNTAISLAKSKDRVFVLSIPDYGVTPFAQGQDAIIGPQIDAFNGINQYEAAKAGVHYLNVTDISRLAANDPSLIAHDGLHPSGKMYGLWVQQLAPMVALSLRP